MVTVQSVKRTIQNILEAFIKMSPEVGKTLFNGIYQKLTEEIYREYQKTGFFYETAYRVRAPAFVQANVNSCCILRGIPPGVSCRLSGLGPYRLGKSDEADSTIPIEKMFHCITFPVQEWWKRVQSRQNFQTVKDWNSFEFLRKDVQSGIKWWKMRPDKDGKISLTRTSLNIPKREYRLYRFTGCRMQMSDILPLWQTENYGYCRIAAAIMGENGTPPQICVEDFGGIERIRLLYLLPPPEQNFFELYSWPSDFRLFGGNRSENDKFHIKFDRIMSSEIYPAFQRLASRAGYRLEKG